MNSEFKRYILYNEFISEEVAVSKDMFKLYVNLYNSRNDYLDEYNTAPAFFQMISLGLLENSILRLAKIYNVGEHSKSEITITKLINYLEQNAKNLARDGQMTHLSEIIANSRSSLESVESDTRKLKTLRDKILAHNDKKFVFKDDIWMEVNLTTDRIINLHNLAGQISNEFRELLELKENVLDAVNSEDYINVLQSIRENLERRADNNCIFHKLLIRILGVLKK